MKQICKLFLPIIIFISVLSQVKAQNAADGNIIPNGGFEEWRSDVLKPVNWIIGNSLSPEQITGDTPPESKGMYALKMWANGGGVSLTGELPVERKKKYTFSFWYKGTKLNHEIKVYFSWYDDSAYKGREQKLSVKTATNWKKKECTIEIPEYANKVGIELTPSTDYSGVGILFDDVSLVAAKNMPGGTPSVEAPKHLEVNAFQGEMEISWDKPVNSDGMKWEVVFDDRMEATVSSNSYMKTKLRPNTRHRIKVRAVKGGEVSPYTEKEESTKEMKEPEHSLDRIPYLRTLEPAGSCNGRFLKLYYNELANPDAKISYKLNGIPVQPQNDTLEFPAFEGYYKRFQLEIHIDEGEGREWDILYNELSVQNF